MTEIKRTPWVSAHRGTKKDIAIGRDYCRVGPSNDVEDPDAQCVQVFGPDKLRRAELIVTAVNAYDKQRTLIETLVKALEIFANEADHYDPPEDDDNHPAWSHDFPIGSLRRASTALAAAKQEGF